MWRSCLLIALLGFSLAGCAGEKGKELFETAQFEEKQGNREHAARLYGEIVRKYPGSDMAKRSETRLMEIGKAK